MRFVVVGFSLLVYLGSITGCVSDRVQFPYRPPGAVNVLEQKVDGTYAPLGGLRLQVIEGPEQSPVSQEIVSDERGLAAFYLQGLGAGNSRLAPDYWVVDPATGAKFPGVAGVYAFFIVQVQEGKPKVIGVYRGRPR